MRPPTMTVCMRLIMGMVMLMVVVVMLMLMVVIRRSTNKCPQTLTQQDRAHHNDERSRCDTEPWVQLLRQNKTRCVQRDEPQRKHADRMCGRNGKTEKHGMARRSTRTNEVGRNDGFAVAR